MNQRERFRRTMRFEAVDRVPFWDYGYWNENIDVWKGQGLPAEVTDIEDYLGIETWTYVPVNIGLCPAFEEVVFEEDDETCLVRDSAGITMRRNKKGSSIPQFIEFPVKNRRDWEEIRERFNADTPERYAADFAERAKVLNANDRPVFLGFDGYFGFLRNLFGLEGLSMMFYDDPQLIIDIQEHMTELRMQVLKRALGEVKIDAGSTWEDMAYNKAPLISPGMYRKFMLPFYKEMTSFFAESGIDIIVCDSDGNVNELLELFIESGITAALPFEVRAGNDIVEVREKHPRFGIIGGIDKIALIRGKKAIGGELERMKSLLPAGGFIPTVDHRVPPDVPYRNYVHYLQEKWRIVHDAASYRNE